MSRTYDIELSCGCLISTESNLLQECGTKDCKSDEEYFNKSKEKSK